MWFISYLHCKVMILERICLYSLHVVDVKGISNEQCRKMYSKIGRGHMINSENLCAGDIIDGGEDSCNGDSGGRPSYLLRNIPLLKIKL